MSRRKEDKGRVDLHKDFSFTAKHPLKFTFALATLWIIAGFGISIIGFFVNERGYLWNLNAGMVVSMIIAAIWSLIKIGVLESVLFKFQTYRDQTFSQKHHVKVKMETKKEYSKKRRAKPWWGVLSLAIISVLIFVITTIIQFS